MSVVKNGLPVPAAKMTTRPFSRCLHPATADVGLGDLGDADRGQDPRVRAEPFQRILERQAVEHRREHARIIGGCPVHALRRGRHPPVEVPAADDDRDLHSALAHLDDLPGDLLDPVQVETELLVAHQSLAGQLQQDPVEDLRALAGFRGALFLNRHSARA